MYLAQSKDDQKYYAIKILKDFQNYRKNKENQKNAEKEYLILEQLEHPNIIRVISAPKEGTLIKPSGLTK